MCLIVFYLRRLKHSEFAFVLQFSARCRIAWIQTSESGVRDRSVVDWTGRQSREHRHQPSTSVSATVLAAHLVFFELARARLGRVLERPTVSGSRLKQSSSWEDLRRLEV